ncbi:MAG: YIP1 family protein [Candidatus Neomarinimicrobiota bacterium]|jgi:hypothetical protein|nr:YIP1 family protein [Candidatus Neomarinimicrobiota bacterium]MDD3966400.1 YIP1 family protein [Candidatus Neomarinimicrobiota bacterium]MDX9780010.1 YIP1 family protein [bacterium]
MNAIKRLGNVFVAPEQCFTSIRDEGKSWADYVIPILLLIAMLVVMLILTSDISEKIQIETIMKMNQLTQEQKDAALQQMQSPIVNVIKYVTSVITIVISVLFTALVFMILGNFIGGGEQKFGTLLVSALYIQLITIPESIIKMILILQKETVNIYIGLASFAGSPDLSSFGFQFLAQFEFFRIWRIVLWVLAFRILYKFSARKSALLVVLTMLLGMLIGAVWTSVSLGKAM